MTQSNRKEPRVNKRILALIEGKDRVIVENVSKKGGFLKIHQKSIVGDRFEIVLQINKYKKVKIQCQPQWSNELGVGFQVLAVEDGKQEFFNQYIEKQLADLEKYGAERVFRIEIGVTLEHTNAFRNVYFANYFRYQGMARERMLLHHVPNITQILQETGVGMETLEAYNKFIQNAYFGDTILVEVTTTKILASQATLIIRFRNRDTGKLIGEGYQSFCCVSPKGRVIKLPQIFDFLEFYNEIQE